MKTHSNKFKNALREIRHLSAIITYESSNTFYILTTESGDNILTESSDILATEKGETTINADSILKINPTFNVELFKTICKSVEFETTIEIPKETLVNIKIGVMVDNDYEYIDFGNYYVKNTEYKADTNTYIMTCYDKMIESMIYYDISINTEISIKNLIIKICNRLGWDYNLDNIFPNSEATIDIDLFKDLELTYRDIFDYISQVVAGNIWFNNNNELEIKYISSGDVDNDCIVDGNDLKDKNITIKEKFGKINYLMISQEDQQIDGIYDQNSINQYGETRIDFKNNVILLYNFDIFKNAIFNQINGLEYYLYDIETIGKLIFDPLDKIKIVIGNDEYETLVLNDDIILTTGLVENMYVEEPDTMSQEIIVEDEKTKKINNAIIQINKANSQMVLKATSDGRITQVELKGDAKNGSEFNVNADNINFSGKTFNLSSENINIVSNNFSVDNEGKLRCSDATITGGNIELKGLSNQSKIRIIRSDDDTSYTKFSPNNMEMIKNDLIGLSISYLLSTPQIQLSSSGDTTQILSSSITTPIVYQTSQEKNKKNIELYENALNEVLNTDIYKYNLKNEDNNDIKHIGVVIGEKRNYTKEIVHKDNNNEKYVDIYSMVSVLWQGVKEQQKIIEELKNEIKEIKNGK